MSDWSLNGTRIFVQKFSGNVKAIVAKLQPLKGGTVYQDFGYETNVRKIVGIVVGDTDLEALKELTENGGTAYTLSSPEGDRGSYYVESVAEDREPVVVQTMRPDLDCDAPVYSVEIVLLEEI